MNIELFRSLVLVVWLTGSAILLGCLLGSWIQHVSRNEAQFRRKPKWKGRSKNMNDLIFAGIVVLFFVVSALYVRFCEKL